MPARSRTVWKIRADGQFDCRVGRKVNDRGKIDQPRFRLGSDLREAQRRDGLLRQMWTRIEELMPLHPIWTDQTLAIAQLVARGESVIRVPQLPHEDRVTYVHRVRALGKQFPMLTINPLLEYGAVFGFNLLNALEQLVPNEVQRIESDQQKFQADLLRSIQHPQMPVGGPTLHQAMRAHIEWLKVEYRHPEQQVTPWGNTQIKQVESLLAHHEDVLLGNLDKRRVEQMLQYWRQRPFKQGTKQRVTRKSAMNYIKTLRRFFRWLHGCDEFTWRKPDDFAEMKTTVIMLDQERGKQLTPEKVFTLDELVLLYKYGQPLDRLLILLGLNCGFGIAESASLLVDEINLHTPHSARHREILDFASTESDSFIKRVRRKNNIYGEFILFEHTAKGIEWALQQRKLLPNFGPAARLLLNGKGEPYDKPSSNGNPNRQIPNLFARLLTRITDDGHPLTKLPFKMLRKTAGQLVKRFSDGEVMGVFHCRGRVDATKDDLDDVYANRPFGKVFRALRQVEQYLQPMFEAAGSNPFDPQPQAYTSRSTIDRIQQLHANGVAPPQIAEAVGKSLATVQRHITRLSGPRPIGRPKKPR